jgi:hypothetical protein
MPIQLNENSISFWPQLSIEQFAECLERWNEVNGENALNADNAMASMVTNDFAYDYVYSFVKSVCKFGGYAGIATRVINNNDPETLVRKIKSAYESAIVGNAEISLSHINELHSLRTVSFASKHLRFFAPENCVVLDSVIAGRCGYPLNSVGYLKFLSACHKLKSHLNESAIRCPSNLGVWRVCDVEAAIFWYLRPPR